MHQPLEVIWPIRVYDLINRKGWEDFEPLWCKFWCCIDIILGSTMCFWEACDTFFSWAFVACVLHYWNSTCTQSRWLSITYFDMNAISPKLKSCCQPCSTRELNISYSWMNKCFQLSKDVTKLIFIHTVPVLHCSYWNFILLSLQCFE